MSLQGELEAHLQHYLDAPTVRNGEPVVRFSHIEIPPYRLEMNFMEIFCQFFGKNNDTQLFFVAPDMEREYDLVPSMYDTASSYSYDEFLGIIHHNLRGDASIENRRKWKRYQPGDWLEDSILPLDSVIVIQVDPNMPAGCVLSLAGIVEWAVDVSRVPGHRNIRIFTLSQSEDCDILKTLVRAKDGDIPVGHFPLAQSEFAAQDPVRGCHVECTANMDRLATNLLQALRQEPMIPKLVVSFNSNLWPAMKRHMNNGDLDNIIEARIGPEQYDRIGTTLSTAETNGVCNVVLSMIGQPGMLPVVAPRFTVMHIVLADTGRSAQAWDNTIRQVSRYPHRLSKEHRRGQLWWAHQAEGTAVTVHIPTGTSVTPDAFVDQGSTSIRFVEAHQLGGLIAAAIDLESRGLNARNIINAAVRYPVIVQEMKDRMAIQCLIKGGKLDLTEMETNIFRRVLPVVEYDYRLAYFVALPAEPLVWRLKVQVAALLSIGCNRVVGVLDTGVSDAVIFRECWGYGKSLAKTGSIWATLGLIKRHLKLLEENKGRYDINRDNLSSRVLVSEDMIREFRTLTSQIFSILRECGSGCVASESVTFEYQELSPEDLNVVHSDLFGAYLYQVTLCSFPVLDGQRDVSQNPIFTNLSTMQRYGTGFPPSPSSLIRHGDLLKDNGTKLIMGITHAISRVDNEHSLQDWTMIPEHIASSWESGKGPSGCTFARIRTGIQHEAVNDIEALE